MHHFKDNNNNHFDLNIYLEIVLNNDDYRIEVSGTPFSTLLNSVYIKAYNQKITQKEQQAIINDTIKSIFEYIREKTEVGV